MLLMGRSIWPGILLGAFAANMFVFVANAATGTFTAIWLSAFISIGNTLEALAGLYLIRKFHNGEHLLHKARGVLTFTVVALIMCLVSAAFGPALICLSGIEDWYAFTYIWLTWWTGDVAGVLIVTPLLLAWARPFRIYKPPLRIVELICLFTASMLIGCVIFAGWLPPGSPFSRSYFIIPMLLWATLRFQMREVVTLLVLFAMLAITGTVEGFGPFSGPTLNISLLSIQGYISTLSITFLTLAASLEERTTSEKALEEAHSKLEALVKERTGELRESRQEIRTYQERIDEILEVLLHNTQLDFSHRARLTETGDELDAVAAGLNTLSEELEYHIRSIRESEERFRALVNSVRDYAIYMMDRQGNIFNWNKGATNLKGYTAEEIVGKNFSKFYIQEDIDKGQPRHNLEEAAATGRYETEGLRVRKDGSLFWANVIITAMKNERGEVAGFVKVTRDMTERKRNEEKVKELNRELELHVAQLEAVNHELEAFTYSVSHDLRAPLRAVHGYTKWLLSEAKDYSEDHRNMMESVMRNAAKMGQLIDDLLSLSRMGRKELYITHVDMTALASNALAELRSILPSIRAEIKLSPLPPAVADSNLVTQVFLNLINNAIKYSSKQEKPVIEIGAIKKEGNTIYYVKDNGIGFDMKYYDKLFGVFQRLHSTEEFEGTGVGLVLVKRIITRHGGSVWAEAEPGKGATFYFSLKQV